MVLGLALALVVAVSNTYDIADRTRWLLLLFALIGGILAALRHQGTLRL